MARGGNPLMIFGFLVPFLKWDFEPDDADFVYVDFERLGASLDDTALLENQIFGLVRSSVWRSSTFDFDSCDGSRKLCHSGGGVPL